MSEKNKNILKKVPDSVSILLVDDHPIILQGLKEMLQKTGRITVCGVAESANEAIMLINKKNPDIVVTDISINGNINGIDLIKAIKERFPDIITIVLTMHQEIFYVERAIRAGARGYLTKNEPSEVLIEAIDKALNGELYLKDDRSRKMLDLVLKRNTEPLTISTDQLSDREFEIFQMIGNGYSIKEIAARLSLSIYTIESHRRNIKKKLNIKTSSDLIKHAIQWTINQEK